MGGIVKAIGNVVGAVFGSGSAPKSDSGAANSEVNDAASAAAQTRSQLLDTAGASAGDALQPGQVSNNNGNTFGN